MVKVEHFDFSLQLSVVNLFTALAGMIWLAIVEILYRGETG